MRVHYEFTTALPPGEVVAALTDFSERRPETWPGLDRARYQVHELGETWALVTEGSRRPNVWARERYDWSVPEHGVLAGRGEQLLRSAEWDRRVCIPGPRGRKPRSDRLGTHPDHRQGLPGRLRGASRQGQGPRVQVSPGQVGRRAQPRGPKGGVGLGAASRVRRDRRACGAVWEQAVTSSEASPEWSVAAVDAREHLRFARVIKDPRTGDQVAPSAHRPQWYLSVGLEVLPVDQDSRRAAEAACDCGGVVFDDHVADRDVAPGVGDPGGYREDGGASDAAGHVEYGDRVRNGFISCPPVAVTVSEKKIQLSLTGRTWA